MDPGDVWLSLRVVQRYDMYSPVSLYTMTRALYKALWTAHLTEQADSRHRVFLPLVGYLPSWPANSQCRRLGRTTGMIKVVDITLNPV